MSNEGLRVWSAPLGVIPGRDLNGQIDSAICAHGSVLLVLSEHTAGGDWVVAAIDHARERRAAEDKRALILIRIDLGVQNGGQNSPGAEISREITSAANFRNWEDLDAFEAAFERLMGDLRADTR